MNGPISTPMRVGEWRVDPLRGEIARAGESVRVDARVMRLLQYLAGRAGEVVSIDEMLDHVWAGVVVTPDSAYQAIASLRRLLGDDPKRPSYIATVPRLGYRLVAAVGADEEVSAADRSLEASESVDGGALHSPVSKTPSIGVLAVGLLALLLAAFYFGFDRQPARLAAGGSQTAQAKSVAVLPFLDLTTQEMNEEYFADGMTEELIGRLGKLPGFQVPGPTSAFFYKGKQVAVADVAQQLGVAWVIDGSVRKSGSTFRVSARLIRVRDGYVAWTDSYDRELGDVLALQKDVALHMTEALQKAIEGADSH
jgi:TolB-like protein/DNA-binding winged helix-turn-helix (wHTH) protein